MNVTRTIIALVALLTFASCSTPTVPASTDQKKGQSGVSTFESSKGDADCDLNLKTVNTKFSLAMVTHRDSEKHHVLLKQGVEQSGCTNSEMLNSMLTADGWVDHFEADRAASWHLQTEGDDGEIVDDFYKVTRRGCCGATPASFYFNLMSGKKVFESAAELVHIDMPNTAFSRYVAFLDTWAALNPEEAKADKTIIGALEYGSAEGPTERVLLHMKTTNPFSIAEIGVASAKEPSKYVQALELWSADGKADPSLIGGFKIRITGVEHGEKENTPTIIVPVTGDKLDIEHAVASNGIEFQRIPSK